MVVQSLARGWADQQHSGDRGTCPVSAEKLRPHKFAVPQRRPPTPAMVEWRFFQPAMDNIRVNLGLDCEALLLEEQVRVVLQRVLEEAKLMYTLRPPPPRRHRKRSRSRPAAPAGPAHQDQVKQPVPKAGTVPAHPLHASPPPATLQQMFKKRKEMDAEAEARRKRARLVGPMFAAASGVQVPVASLGSPAAPPLPAVPVAPTTPAMAQTRLSPGPAPPAANPGPGRAALGVLPTPAPAPANPPAVNYLSPKWDPARITPDTMFVMGARANKVLGYETSRGRLYTKHQDLFKYASDQEDKEWLARNQLIQPTGGKAFLCIMQDIHELAVSQEYKDNPLVNLLELKGFRAPDFLLKKIRAYMRNLRTEPLDDLSGLLEMDLLQEDGVTTMDDSSLMELALEYGVTLMSDDTSPSPSPAAAPAAGPPAPMSPEAAEATAAGSSSIPVEAAMAAAADGPALATTATSAPAPAAASNPAAAGSAGAGCVPLASSTPASPGGRGAERTGAERAKGLTRSHSLPAPAPFIMESLALEELELYIKSHSVEDAHFEHIMTSSSAEVEAADVEADAEGDGALDASLDASLEANLDANLDLNLDVNLDVSGTEHSQLELAWDFIGELNTPTHSPSPSVHASEETDRAHEFPSEGPVAEDAEHSGGPSGPGVTAPSAPETLDSAAGRGAPDPDPVSGETSLAMSHATLTALLSGNTLEGLDIPDGLL
ncbi:Deoxynucleotidyltransferase terminal-interacting protein 1 [Frankliniella fusca]|uniref:Deoxynucleotidyltransferase terminal-interacting protein 1 n=1 Tax=Frankliniella fusca TaxID=407009 RepID=A0AAE1L9X4_9NEOP|nr:Deoxynucleotidyltransferase terminal-interacting protein 1 [Frankliniella fusca]